ncbi:MAG TPA: hypothetical protein VE981_03810, partial [Planctomycetota bacterium]|nr:hypothetical protein [Planctomycetota bacterium]
MNEIEVAATGPPQFEPDHLFRRTVVLVGRECCGQARYVTGLEIEHDVDVVGEPGLAIIDRCHAPADGIGDLKPVEVRQDEKQG